MAGLGVNKERICNRYSSHNIILLHVLLLLLNIIIITIIYYHHHYHCHYYCNGNFTCVLFLVFPCGDAALATTKCFVHIWVTKVVIE